MPHELTTKWKAIPFPFPLVYDHVTPPFDPVICHERGVLIAGSGNALAVFQIFSSQRVWFSVTARVWITGFCVSAGSLYVQDGPVLSGWDLTQGGCFAAINLVTKRSWKIPADATVATQPPAELYELPASSAALQSSLMAARTSHATESSDPALLTAAKETLTSAMSASASVIFSAPVIRSLQFDGLPGGQVFSLGLDGTIIALDDSLSHVGTFKYEAPLRAELALSEVLQPSGAVQCRLHYVTTTGAVTSLDAMQTPPKPLTKWDNVGKVEPAEVMPLRFQDGLLWGGGILGAYYFATKPDASEPLVLTIPPPENGTHRWKSCAFSVADKLVLVSNNVSSRLVSYDKSAKVRDRWRLRSFSALPYRSAFWTIAGLEPSPSTPRLVIEVGYWATAGDLGFRVLLANTVDSPLPDLTKNYPPQVETLDEGVLRAGKQGGLIEITEAVGHPIVTQQTLYCVVGGKNATGTHGAYLAAFALAPTLTSILPKAQAKLAALQQMVQPIRLRIVRTDRFHTEKSPGPTITGPYALGHARLPVSAGTETRDVETDELGIAILDGALAGQSATVPHSAIAGWNRTVTCGSVTLRHGELNTIGIDTSNRW